MTCSDINVSMVRPHLQGVPRRPLPEGYVLCTSEYGDEPQLAGLLSAAFEGVWDVSRVAATLTRAPEVRAVYGVFRRDQLVATASSQHLPERDPEAGFVHWLATHWLATHPDYRAFGLAAALLAHVLGDFSARGYLRARLDTQPERLPALRLYLKFGFVPEYEPEYEVAGVDQRELWSNIFAELLGAKPVSETP